MECLVADVALVGLLAGVREPVVLVVALLVEPLPAELARVRLEPVVDPHVRVQRRAPERAGIQWCRVRFQLSCEFTRATPS